MEISILGQFVLAVFTVTVWRHLPEVVTGQKSNSVPSEGRVDPDGLPGDGRAEVD